MKSPRSVLSITRSLLIIAIVGLVTTGVTYAALQSPNVSLTGNSINTGSADLRISTDNLTFSTPSVAGFSFNGVVPGGAAAPAAGNTFYLKNFGGVNLSLKVGISNIPFNANGIDYAKTFLIFTRTDDNSTPVSISLKNLIDNYASGGTALNEIINAGTTATFSLQASMNSDAYSGTSASINGINLAFLATGT